MSVLTPTAEPRGGSPSLSKYMSDKIYLVQKRRFPDFRILMIFLRFFYVFGRFDRNRSLYNPLLLKKVAHMVIAEYLSIIHPTADWMETKLDSFLSYRIFKNHKFIRKIAKSSNTLCFYMVVDPPQTLFVDRDRTIPE